jgi:peptidoglycan hydrolase-like protein with peptidoglycan-binding domain
MDPKTTQKPTGLALVTSTLNRGSTGDQVKALQQYLIGMGYTNVKPDGVYGPITEMAVKQFQTDNGLSVDGVFGSKTLSKANTMGSTTDTGGNGQPRTQAELDAIYNKAVTEHPVFAGNSPAALEYAKSTGDFSTLLNDQGKPFSQAEQEAAMVESEKALAPGFNIAQQKDTADTEASLQASQLSNEKYLADQATQFQTDKTNLDQNAADQGVLFSGGRVQKEKSLGDLYNRNQAYNTATTGLDIANTARGFQSDYGDKAASGLSKYYNLGGNTYNPNVATGGVSRSNLSSIYNPSGLGYQGTKTVANKAAAQTRAAGLLWNKGNKLVASGLKNQYK